ncbi:ester cyclase [Candidatus Bipolaricaulota bacterium]|nr:ester cyclase [Candidatus Bipolaricaulota bacterium]
MYRTLCLLLLGTLIIGIVGVSQTPVALRAAEGFLLLDNDTGAEVVRLGILFDGPISLCMEDVVVFGGGAVTRLDVGLRTAWIDAVVNPSGTLQVGFGGGASALDACWVASTTEKNKAVTRWLIESVWNAGDLEAVGDFIAPEFLFHDISLVGDLPGVMGYTMFAAGSLAAFPDTHFAIEDVVASDDMIALRVLRTGTHLGDLNGIPPTGVSVNERAIVIYRMSDGKIAEGWMQYDALGLLVQLGLIPPMGPPLFAWDAGGTSSGDRGTPEVNTLLASRDPLEIWNEQNLALIDEIIGEDFVAHYETKTVTGIADYKDHVVGTLAAFPDFQISLEEVFAEGDLVVFRSTASGTHSGPLGPIPATGMAWEVGGMVIRRIADGKIVELWQLNDMLSLLTQIGLVPPLQ